MRSFFNYLTGSREKSFLVLTVGHVLIHVFSMIHLALVPVFMTEFSLTPIQIGLMVTTPALARIIVSIPAGIITDRIGHRSFLLTSLIILGLSAISVSITTDIYLFTLTLSILHASISFFHPASLSVTSELFPKRSRGKALGIHIAGGSIGMALGPISLGLLMLHFNWRLTYLLWSIPVLFLAIILMRLDIHYPRQDKDLNNGKKVRETTLRSVMKTNFLILILAVAIWWMGDRGIFTFLTTYLVTVQGTSESSASIVLGLTYLTGFLGAAGGGFISDKFGERKCILGSFSASLCMLLGVSFSHSLWLFILFLLIYGFFAEATSSATSSLVAHATPISHRGFAYGLYFFPTSLLAAFSPIVAGWIIEVLDIWYIFPFALILLFLSLILLYLMPAE